MLKFYHEKNIKLPFLFCYIYLNKICSGPTGIIYFFQVRVQYFRNLAGSGTNNLKKKVRKLSTKNTTKLEKVLNRYGFFDKNNDL